jgi:hypothetical protein
MSARKISRHKSFMEIETNPLDEGVPNDNALLKIENLNDARQISNDELKNIKKKLLSVE